MTRTLTTPLGPLGADLLQLAGLEEAQQQPLHAQRHLADFVEEDRALVGDFELARLVAIGAGEAALDVAEQLRLEQRLGQAGAVDRDEGSRGAGPLRLNRAGDELLADAALAGDEHLRVGPGDCAISSFSVTIARLLPTSPAREFVPILPVSLTRSLSSIHKFHLVTVSPAV